MATMSSVGQYTRPKGAPLNHPTDPMIAHRDVNVLVTVQAWYWWSFVSAIAAWLCEMMEVASEMGP